MRIVDNDERQQAKAETPGGLAAWLLARFGGGLRVRFQRSRDERRMKLMETLPLGGKRQIMLVVCDGQRFLVGASADGVQTIVAMAAAVQAGSAGLKVSDGGS